MPELYMVAIENDDGTFWEDPTFFDTEEECVEWVGEQGGIPEQKYIVLYECRQVKTLAEGPLP